MNREQFIERVGTLGLLGPDEAATAVTATLSALGRVLVESERRAVSEALPEELRLLLDARHPAPNLGLEGFYESVQRNERARPGRAREHAQIVCRALGAAIAPEPLRVLIRHVPWLESLLALPPPGATVASPEHFERPARPEGATLATGKPGSRHALADARPERAHSHSVALSDDPHGDTKLSSSPGLTQEREQETLASGKPPGPKRPLSG